MTAADFTEARCIGHHTLFDSTDPYAHKYAREMCAECPVIVACHALLEQEQKRAYGIRPSGTWAGKLLGKTGRTLRVAA